MKIEKDMVTVKRTRRKKQKWQIGDYFLVPLANGEFAIGQAVAEIAKFYSIVCVLFNIKARSKEDALEAIKKLTEENIVSVVVTTRDGLDYSYWIAICDGQPWSVENYIDLKRLEKSVIGTTIEGSGVIDDFFDAFYGLKPWDMYYEPDSFDKLLVSPDKKPKKLLYKKDVENKK